MFRFTKTIITLSFLLIMASVVSAVEQRWTRINDGIPLTDRISCVENDDKTGVLYAGTDNGLYAKNKGDEIWKKLDLPVGKTDIKEIAVSGGDIYAAGGSSLFKGTLAGDWKLMQGKTGIKGVSAKGDTGILAWTDSELYMVKENSWKEIAPIGLSGVIDDVAVKDGIIYLAAGGDVHCSGDDGIEWGKYTITGGREELAEVEDMVESPEEEEIEVSPEIRELNVSGEKVTVATGKGILIADGRSGSFENISTSGLPSSSIIDAVCYNGKIFAANTKRVFLFDRKNDFWQTIFESYNGKEIAGLKMIQGDLLVIQDRGIYRGSIDRFEQDIENCEKNKLMWDSASEPTILEVQRMAIEYAEVSQDKIRNWRTGAAWKAILPKLSLGYSRSTDDNVELYTSSTTYYAFRGPQEYGDDWGVDLSWELSDLIWNDAQTSIDVRSKLMVQLRDDILEEVTRLYFERRRLIQEVAGGLAHGAGREEGTEQGTRRMAHGEKEMRIEELTAYIDALTGGGFSEAIGKP